jgi:hypothetical protein
MKTIKKVAVRLVVLQGEQCAPEINEMEEGVFYYSKEYQGANHLCLCGCKMPIYIPIKEGEWSIDNTNDKLTVKPSLAHRNGCKSHYIITNGIANFV